MPADIGNWFGYPKEQLVIKIPHLELIASDKEAIFCWLVANTHYELEWENVTTGWAFENKSTGYFILCGKRPNYVGEIILKIIEGEKDSNTNIFLKKKEEKTIIKEDKIQSLKDWFKGV